MPHSEYLQPICVSMVSRTLNPLGLVAQGRTSLELLELIGKSRRGLDSTRKKP